MTDIRSMRGVNIESDNYLELKIRCDKVKPPLKSSYDGPYLIMGKQEILKLKINENISWKFPGAINDCNFIQELWINDIVHYIQEHI
uniref:Uncharacterized protein n=1 Tax=Megaselia scalaris TaxID=36166 RepID=T1GL36_MEGSC